MAAPRHALVIGNADYKLGPLANPIKDASDFATVLKGLDFEVEALINANEDADFSERVLQLTLGVSMPLSF